MIKKGSLINPNHHVPNIKHSREEEKERTFFRNKQSFLEGKQIIYSADENCQGAGNSSPYPKVSPYRFTIVLELVDIIFKIIDTTTEKFLLTDLGIKQLSVKGRLAPSQTELVVLKYMIHPMLQSLKELSQVCELIAYTYLPRSFIKEF